MSESLDGVSVAAMRQNEGRLANAFAPRPPRPGAVNAPGATVCASVTATCGLEYVERLSQGTASAGAANKRKKAASFICGTTLSGSPTAGAERPGLLQLF